MITNAFKVLSIILTIIRINGYVNSNKRFLSNLLRSPASLQMTIELPKLSKDLVYPLGKFSYSLFPFQPESTGRRKSILTEIVPGVIWTIDQLQGFINVNVPVRCTIIKLKDGLFINNPVAPTNECIEFVRNIEKQHGKVKYIALSTLGVEHKGTAGAFSSYFPNSIVYYQPGQYSFPINLPISFFFPIGKTLKEIPKDAKKAPWYDEIDHEILGPLIPSGAGGFSETAFYHRSTNTLLVTDTIVKVVDEPPAIVQDDPRALLYHARDKVLDIVEDTQSNRRKGWRRMVLFGLCFQPSGIRISDLSESLEISKKVDKEMRKLGRGVIPIDEGLYPWEWIKDELPNFRALQGGLLVAPILQKLILNREPNIVIEWINKVSKWNFKRIIPCHLENNLSAKPIDFINAFRFLEERKQLQPFPFSLFDKPYRVPQATVEDGKLLDDASELLTKQGVLFKEAPKVKSILI